MRLPREFTLAEIAHLIGGTMQGAPDTKVASVAMSPLNAGPGDLALVFEPKLLKRISECKASAVIVPTGANAPLPSVAVERPLLALAKMLATVQPRRFFPEAGAHPSAVVDATAELAEGVAVGANVVIGPGTKVGRGTRIAANSVIGGGVVIGEGCLIHPGCLVADYVHIGNRVILQQGANIGSDGFGYVTERPSNMEKRLSGLSAEVSDEPNPHVKIPQIGTVVIEDDVEIGAGATIARGTMGATIIGSGTKIDNQVMIAHNCRIGREVLIVAHTGVAGSCVLGDRVILAGHVAVKDHITMGKDAIAEGQCGVMRDVGEGEVVVGTPNVGVRDFFKQIAIFRRGPEIAGDVKALKSRLAELEKKLAERELVR